MTKQLNLTSLLLLVTSLSFAQQSIVNTSRSNTKDKVVVDTVKKPLTTAEQSKTAPREVDGKGRPASICLLRTN